MSSCAHLEDCQDSMGGFLPPNWCRKCRYGKKPKYFEPELAPCPTYVPYVPYYPWYPPTTITPYPWTYPPTITCGNGPTYTQG